MFIVDIPREDGEWTELASFDTKEQAIKYCKKFFGADDEGKVNLISEIGEDEE